MPKRIIEFLSQSTKIPKSEIETLVDLVKPMTLKKGDYLYQEGKVPKYGAFVLSGILREFYTDAKGTDYIRRFAYENWWMVDLYELTEEKIALCSVQAIKETHVLTFTKEDYQTFLKMCPITSQVLQGIITAGKYSLAKKEKEKRSLSAQENYEILLKKHPKIDKKIPLFHIASYLNIKPESLSRIRRHIKNSK